MFRYSNISRNLCDPSVLVQIFEIGGFCAIPFRTDVMRVVTDKLIEMPSKLFEDFARSYCFDFPLGIYRNCQVLTFSHGQSQRNLGKLAKSSQVQQHNICNPTHVSTANRNRYRTTTAQCVCIDIYFSKWPRWDCNS